MTVTETAPHLRVGGFFALSNMQITCWVAAPRSNMLDLQSDRHGGVNVRKWLAEELKAEGYSASYVAAIGHRSRFTEVRQQAKRPIDKAEARGRIAAYGHMAVLLVMTSHGITEAEAEKLVNKHTREWTEAREAEKE